MDGVEIRRGWSPGAIGRIVEMHGAYYHVHWGFGTLFEAKVAAELAGLAGRYEPGRDELWTAAAEGRIHGSIVIDGLRAADEGAHLRWFIVSDGLRGGGIGRRLIGSALDFCRARSYERVFLWTFVGLDAARHLYEESGFVLVEQRRGARWGTEVNEQRFELRLGTSPK